MSYIRCNFCDSNFNPDTIETKPLEKIDAIKHERVQWNCPACGNNVKSFVFKDNGEEVFEGVINDFETKPLEKIRFTCKECNQTYSWLLEGNVKHYCAYCCGKYPDGTKCGGGRGNITEKEISEEELNKE